MKVARARQAVALPARAPVRAVASASAWRCRMAASYWRRAGVVSIRWYTGAASSEEQCRTRASTSRRRAGTSGVSGARPVTASVRRRAKPASSAKTSASLAGKCEKSVVTATSASAATSRMPTSS